MTPEAPPEVASPQSVESLSAFVAEMTDLRCIGAPLPPLFWFRGHAAATWPLLPGVLRVWVQERVRQYTVNPDNDPALHDLGLETTEKTLNEEFRRMAASLLPSTADTVDVYFLAQHHGLPTRLLDWTGNPLSALFFAAVERPTEDGEVVALVVDWRLSFGDDRTNRVGAGLPWPPVTQRNQLVIETVRYVFDEGPRPEDKLVLPLRPDLRYARLSQQDACFTLHMPGCPGIQELTSNSRRYRVPASAKRQLLVELESVGVNWASLFPDLDHITRQMKVSWGFE